MLRIKKLFDYMHFLNVSADFQIAKDRVNFFYFNQNHNSKEKKKLSRQNLTTEL